MLCKLNFPSKNTNSHINPSFKGTTKLYAMSDSHQETRKTSGLLSRILDETKDDKNVLFVNNGDMYKGIYHKPLERDCYLKMKKAKPDAEMVFTLGNNDFGFDKESLNYLIDTIKTYAENGIRTVCANIFESSGKRPDWLAPYTVVERDGDRTFITGFCIDNINTAKFGIVPKKQSEVIDEIAQSIKREKPDNVVVLNHDYMQSSQNIVKMLEERGIKTDVVIGGHDHDYVVPDEELNIYYPMAFSDSMYKMNIVNSGQSKKVSDVEMIESTELPLSEIFIDDIQAYEEESHLLEPIAPYTLNLWKQYSKPCPLGSFLADAMKECSNSDIAFFSTGFLMRPLEYKPNTSITRYLFKKTMVAETPIKTVELTAQDLKEVFDNAMRTNGYGKANTRFLQCSNNVKIEGRNNPQEGFWEVKQIYIDDEALLNDDGSAKDTSKKYKCAIDSYIADGGQGYNVIQSRPKSDVIINESAVKINEVLFNALKEAPSKYESGSEYPAFEISEI